MVKKFTFEMTSPEYVKSFIAGIFDELRLKGYKLEDIREKCIDSLEEKYTSNVGEDIGWIAKSAFRYGRECVNNSPSMWLEQSKRDLKRSRLWYRKNKTEEGSPERKEIDRQMEYLRLEADNAKMWGSM